MKKTGDLKLIQELNQSIIINTIRREGPISRSEIAKRTRLSPTTVASAVSELINDGLAVDGPAGKSSGGRRPVLVEFEPDKKFLIGVSITNSGITIAKMNLNASVQHKSVYLIDFAKKNESMMETIVTVIKRYVAQIGDLSTCIGISVIVPGIVDSLNGVIRYNSKLGLHNIPLRQIIEEQFGIKTWVDNDANAIILAEKQWGAYQDKDNLIYIQVGDGLGAGIVINNSIFRGFKGGAGEFGHISINQSRTRCDCGNTGCLENYVSWPAIYSRIVSALSRGKQSFMLEAAEGNIGKITQDVFREALERGDGLAESVVEEIIPYLAAGMVNIVNLFNPQVILIGWEVTHNSPAFISNINHEVKSQIFDMFADDLEIQPTTLGEDFELKGAAAVLLTEIFDFSFSAGSSI